RGATTPCDSAAALLKLDAARERSRSSQAYQALFLLVSSLFEHALFTRWPRSAARDLRKDLRDLKLERDPTLMGLYHFLNGRRAWSLPSTLERQLTSLCDLLDPALANPDDTVQMVSGPQIKLRDIDVRFSQSVSEGLAFVSQYEILAPLEVSLLQR